MANCTFRSVSGLNVPVLFMTLETVAVETPACLATSRIVGRAALN